MIWKTILWVFGVLLLIAFAIAADDAAAECATASCPADMAPRMVRVRWRNHYECQCVFVPMSKATGP